MPLNPSVPLTLLYGDAPLLIERAADGLIDALLPRGSRTYGLTLIDLRHRQRVGRWGSGDRWGDPDLVWGASDPNPVARVAAQLQTGSLMADRRVLLLQGVDDLPAAQQNELARQVGDLRPDVYVIMIASASRQQAGKGLPVAAKLRAVVEQQGQSAAFITPFEREMAQWAVGEAGRMGKRLDRAAAERLVEMVGRDHARLFSELEKLCSYVGDAREIALPDVSEAASRSVEASSFDLVDAIAEGDARRALSMLPDLLAGQNVPSTAIPLLGMIARQLRLVWQAGYLAQSGAPVDRGGRPATEVTALLPEQQNVVVAARSGFVARKLARYARSLGDREIAAALQRVLYADRALKGQTDEHLEPRLVMERLVTELCLLARSPGKAARGQ